MSRAQIANVLKHAKRIECRTHLFDNASTSVTEFVKRCSGRSAQEANNKCEVIARTEKSTTPSLVSVTWNNDKMTSLAGAGYTVGEIFEELQFHVAKSGAKSIDHMD